MEKAKKNFLLGSAATIEGILQVIAKFYCGEEKTLAETEKGWDVVSPVRGKLEAVTVVKKGKRYRFEMVGK